MTIHHPDGLSPLQVAKERVYLTPFPLSPLFRTLLVSLISQRQGPKTTTELRESYDYIIVGGGSAGSTLAGRLSDVPCVSVLLLEAGKSPPILTDVPVAAGSFVQSDIDWKYSTTPQKHTGSGLLARKVILPQGKVLGGGSTINGMIANRGHRFNYDEWAKMGATGWSYREVLPYFIKMEDNRDYEYVKNGYHGVGGPLTVSRPRYEPEVKRPIAHSAISMGIPFVDVNAETMVGFWDLQSTLQLGQRCSAAKSYLVPIENRTNLDIVTEAMVHKIIIDDHRTAVGVEFLLKGIIRKMRAVKEVIISAGAINTPQLLMLSGIGPSVQLDKYHIPVIADLPVGRNLQEHCGAFIAFELGDAVEPLSKKLMSKKCIQEYIDTKTGPLEYTSGFSLIAFLSNNQTGFDNNMPDHELYFQEISAEGAKLRIGLTGHAYVSVFGPYVNKPILACVSQVLHPKSRGTVTLKGSSIYTPPEIDPNYLEDPQDVADVVAGLKNCLKILSHPEMAAVGARRFNTTFPGCEIYKDLPDQTLHLTCIARAAVMSISHPVGTASMGQALDPSTVVDPELRVKTIAGLRVVDASVMPTIPWGNTNLPTIMIAERAADLIKSTISCAVPKLWKK